MRRTVLNPRACAIAWGLRGGANLSSRCVLFFYGSHDLMWRAKGDIGPRAQEMPVYSQAGSLQRFGGAMVHGFHGVGGA